MNFYSANTTVDGEPVPVGAVISAYDSDRAPCGETIVTRAGWYGLLSVHRDDPDTPEDEGAEPGDVITFTIDGRVTEVVGQNGGIWTHMGDVVRLDLAVTSSSPCFRVEDVSGDGGVDVHDIMLVASRWRTRLGMTAYRALYDVDKDGDVDIVDVQQVAALWGTRC